MAQWQRNRFVIGRLVGSNPLAGSTSHNGGVGEWLKPAVCKIVALTGYAGSNPAPSTSEIDAGSWKGQNQREGRSARRILRPHSSVVEHALGKGEVIGSIPIVGSR